MCNLNAPITVLTYGISILIGSNEETEKEKKENKKKKKKKGAEKEKHDISLCLHGTRGDSGFRQMIEIRKDLAEFTLGEVRTHSVGHALCSLIAIPGQRVQH